jgi:uncharacterized protein (DUF849 family)
MHVRDPETGKPYRATELYGEVVERIRAVNIDVIINLTAGMGGDVEVGAGDKPLEFGAATDLVGAKERLVHIESLRPDICTLDCGSPKFGDGNDIYVSTPAMLREGTKRVQELGVKPELECFDTGNLWFANQMMTEGLLDAPAMYQICLGIPWGAPADTASMKHMADMVPHWAFWSASGISSMQMPMVAQAVLLGGNVRIGLEDNLYLERVVMATNAQLVEKAAEIIRLLGSSVASATDTRSILNLKR